MIAHRSVRKSGLLRSLSGFLAATTGLAACLPANAAPPPVEQAAPASPGSAALQDLLAQYWQWWLKRHPFEATSLGVRDYDDQVPDYSLEAADRNAADAATFLSRLDKIPQGGLNEEDQVNRTVLAWVLSDTIQANRFGQRMMLFNSYYSWPQSFADLPNQLPFYTRADYQSYLARLSLYPRMNAEAMAVSARALKEGYVQPCVTLGGLSRTVRGAVEGKPEETRFYAPFERSRPSDMTEAEWAAMKERAVDIISDVVRPEYLRFADWIETSYIPHCRTSAGASAMPGGAAWYASRVRAHTTTDLTPAQVHQIGLDEVARITTRMDELARKAGYPSRQAYIAKLQSDPAYFATTPKQMLEAAAWEAKRHDGLMPRYFGTLPRLPYGVKPIPAETAETTAEAYYMPGSPKSGISGTFYINTSKLNQRPLWELPALVAHEAVPGHHNQIALQQEVNLPEFRRNSTDFTAYVEGWGLYSEYLGEEMGLYDTPEKLMGRLSFEAWRASRLVVDTGLHAMGWDKARAAAFMKANTALTDANIDAEVNRYISWPGQALGYKIGEIRIRQLRDKAQTALGPRFDLRAFHDEVLSLGPVPLTVLDQQIDRWIANRSAIAKH